MNLFFRSSGSFLTSFFVVLLLLEPFIGLLRSWHIEQFFRGQEEVRQLATLHEAKKKTPIMGGLLIYFASSLAAFLWARSNSLLIYLFLAYSCFLLIGFGDDWAKLRGRSSRGLSGRRKLAIQLLLAFGLLFSMRFFSPELLTRLGELWLPGLSHPLFLSIPLLVLGFFWFLVLAGTSNSVNLSDGLDGLATSSVLQTTICLLLLSLFSQTFPGADKMGIPYVAGAESITIYCSALIGALLAFLCYNSHPAKIFMGDTGSLGLGGFLGMAALLLGEPFLLLFFGAIFVIESCSDMIQVGYFKATGGKRIFRMAPIHHHFELGGWSETQIFVRFFALAVLLSLVGWILLVFHR